MLSNYLASVIEGHHGKVLYDHLVNEIIVKDGVATGVKFSKKSNSNEEQESIYGKTIIANAAVPNIPALLLAND